MKILKESIESERYLDIVLEKKDLKILENFNLLIGMVEIEDKILNISVRKDEEEIYAPNTW